MSRAPLLSPLAVAGLASIGGVLAARHAALPAAAAAGLLLLWAVARGPRAALVVAAALAAGLAAGLREELRLGRHVACGLEGRARGPPPATRVGLEVERVGEDPFAGRSWLVGRDATGLGVRCGWPGRCPDDLAAGARVRAVGRASLPAEAGNPAQRDPVRALAAAGASVSLDLRHEKNLELARPAPSGLPTWIERTRRRAIRRLAAAMPDDVSGIAAALFLGERGGVADADRRLFERTGTIHVLAISGMHVVLLAAFVSAALRRAGAGPRTAAAVTLVLSVLYVPIAGGEAPIRRAVFGMAFAVLALAAGRPVHAGTALGGAATIIALADPADVDRVGFRLSFLATAAIAFLGAPWYRGWSGRHRLLARFPAVRRDRPLRLAAEAYLLRAMPASLAASLATMAVVARDFGRVSPWAPLTNLALGPLVALALPLIPAVACGAGILAPPLALLLRASRGILEAADALPFGAIAVAPPPVATVLLWTAGVFALRAGLRRGAPCLLLAGALWAPEPPPLAASLHLFDVGHGQAALVRFPDGASALVDAGSRTQGDAARRIVLPALRALGIRRLEVVVCTHADADHWNAVPEILGAVEVGALLVGADAAPELVAAARDRGIPIRIAEPDTLVHAAAGVSLRVVAAGAAEGASSNDRSLVLLLDACGRRILLPADREEEGLRALLEEGVEPVDVLVAPHHGAACREARALGSAARPEWLLVSAARGFADPATLRAYRARRILATDRHGCVVVRVEPGGALFVEPFR